MSARQTSFLDDFRRSWGILGEFSHYNHVNGIQELDIQSHYWAEIMGRLETRADISLALSQFQSCTKILRNLCTYFTLPI